MNKKWLKIAVLSLAIFGGGVLALRAASVAGVAVQLLGINSSVSYTGNTTYTLVDVANATANLIMGALTATSATISGATTITGTVTQSGGAVSQSTTTFTGVVALPQLSQAAINALQASTTYQMVACNNCAKSNGGLGTICMSTGTTAIGQFVILGTSQTTTSICQ